MDLLATLRRKRETIACNVCGGATFLDMNKREKVRCSKCGSLERTRVIKLTLDDLGFPEPGMRVLHLAPEGGLANHLKSRVGEANYDARDIDVERYAHVKVSYFDLVKDADKLPSEQFDLIIHSHVIEHLPCNVTAILYHLHRSLTKRGVHVFSFPIYGAYYEESLFPLSEEERHRRFGQFDHVRKFGVEDIGLTLGMIFRLPEQYDLTGRFTKNALRSANVPEEAWRGFTGHSVFAMRKDDLLLR